MAKTYKDSYNADKIKKRYEERRNKYIHQNVVYINNILNENPRIRNAYSEYRNECLSSNW